MRIQLGFIEGRKEVGSEILGSTGKQGYLGAFNEQVLWIPLRLSHLALPHISHNCQNYLKSGVCTRV